METKDLLVILGATAVGKTNLAVQIADFYDAEIISADSRQVFRGMDIGTGKDLTSYQVNGRKIPFHLINICNAGEKYHVHAFKHDFYQVFEQIKQKNKLPILCGGTGMYIHSLLQNQVLTAVPVNTVLRKRLEEQKLEDLLIELKKHPVHLYQQADLSTKKRIIRAIEIVQYLVENDLPLQKSTTLNPFIIGLVDEVEIRRKKILDRLNQRLKSGLIEEVAHLLEVGVSAEMLVFYGLEYKFVLAYLEKQLTLDELKEKLGTAICQYAKRQMTFFRKMEKDGQKIYWLKAIEDLNTLKNQSIQLLNPIFEKK